MPDAVKPQRRYHSPRRREQADATRRAILDAARALFLDRGYVPTSIAAIARRAGVSGPTVYATFGTKRAILATLVDVSIAGDDAPVPIADRPWVTDLRGEPDARRRMRLLAREGAAILERRAPLDAVVMAAAASDPEIRALWDGIRATRHAGQRHLLALVAGRPSALRAGLTLAAAADILYAVGSPETWRALVDDRGWSAKQFRGWYSVALERLLLPG